MIQFTYQSSFGVRFCLYLTACYIVSRNNHTISADTYGSKSVVPFDLFVASHGDGLCQPKVFINL
jgi:hypothetical protein